MSEVANERRIGSKTHPNCILCGAAGRRLYLKQEDRLFRAFGLWNLLQCPTSQCGLIWLNPMPLPQDLGQAYVHYYTHDVQAGSARKGRLRQLYWLIKRGYWAGKYNYKNGLNSLWVSLLGKLLYFFPIRRGEVDVEIRFLPALPGGRLLDVGCGSGEWLQLMHGLGWRAEGIDFDQNAVAVAAQNGLQVSLGSLEQKNYPNDTFDAVTLNHVIEHVPDPVATLAECARILKPGGRIVVATPNNSSLGHRFFKNHWRGLEPPRHLHIFSPESIRRAFGLAGFQTVSVRPQIARSVIYESFLLWRGATGDAAVSAPSRLGGVFTRMFNALEFCLIPFAPSVSDCMSAIATK
jgi:2-polyprenyl-3-methyl-5-hydroxy-6-metoxy-1,4-benzoquinol methylase